MLALPVELPLQFTLAVTLAEKEIAAGCVMVTLAVELHPLISDTVIVYVPAVNPVAVAFVWLPGVHK